MSHIFAVSFEIPSWIIESTNSLENAANLVCGERRKILEFTQLFFACERAAIRYSDDLNNTLGLRNTCFANALETCKHELSRVLMSEIGFLHSCLPVLLVIYACFYLRLWSQVLTVSIDGRVDKNCGRFHFPIQFGDSFVYAI